MTLLQPDRVARHGAWIAAALAALLYLPTLGGTFVYDDLFHCLEDPRLASPRNWGGYWTDAYYPGGVDRLWRPVVSISYAIQTWIHGPMPWAFHLVNVALHALAAALVARVALRLAGPAAGLIAGLLFAAHPVHVEAVAYIVGRADLLCTIGVLGAVVLALRPGWMTPGRAIGIWACILLSIGAKEQGMVSPALVGLAVRARPDRAADGEGAGRSASGLLAAGVLLTLAAYFGWREHILGWFWDESALDWGSQPMIRSEALDRVLIPFSLLGRCVALLVAPLQLSPDYGLGIIGPHQRWSDPLLYLGMLAAGALAWGAVRAMLRRSWRALLLLAGLVLTWAIIANIKLIGTIFGERLLYLPSAFVLILIAWLIARACWRTTARRGGVATAAAIAVILVLFALRTVTYAIRWNDRLVLYSTSLEEHPRSARLCALLAEELIRRYEFDRAGDVLAGGIGFNPDYWLLWRVRAQLQIQMGRFAEAQRSIDRAWQLGGHSLDLMAIQARLPARAGR